ncbi:MAG: hypothetical protein WC817_00710 [Patescibacteria group bacterium]|jgi:hypothetical protein
MPLKSVYLGGDFDESGVRIPPPGMQGKAEPADRRLQLTPSSIFYPALYRTASDAFGGWRTATEAFRGYVEMPLPAETGDHCTALRLELGKQRATAGILNGVCLPWAIPQVQLRDHGEWMETMFQGVAHAYSLRFPSRSVYRYFPMLGSQVSLAPESRLELLFERLTCGPVFGLYFPEALRGYSVLAQREQMATLSEGFVLSGPDAIFAMLTHAATLFRDFKTPGYTLPGYQLEGADPLLVREESRGLVIDTVDAATASGGTSGGLSYVGF